MTLVSAVVGAAIAYFVGYLKDRSSDLDRGRSALVALAQEDAENSRSMQVIMKFLANDRFALLANQVPLTYFPDLRHSSCDAVYIGGNLSYFDVGFQMRVARHCSEIAHTQSFFESLQNFKYSNTSNSNLGKIISEFDRRAFIIVIDSSAEAEEFSQLLTERRRALGP